MEPLLALQEIDGRIREFQQEIRDIPARKGDEKGRLSATSERLENAKDRYMDVQTKVSDVQQEIAAAQEKAKKFKQQQMTLKTNAEFRAMEQQIRDTEREIDHLVQDQLLFEERLAPIKSDIDALQAKLDSEKVGVDANIKELEERQAQAAEMLGRLEKERVAAIANVDKRQLAYYERLSKSRWPVAVPLENGGVCGGCHLTQPPSTPHLLKRNNALVACQMCGRLLYIEE